MTLRELIIFTAGCFAGAIVTGVFTFVKSRKRCQETQKQFNSNLNLNTNYTLSPEPIRYEIK